MLNEKELLLSAREQARILLGSAPAPSGKYEVYVLLFERYDGEEFYYVGQTTDLSDRLTSHIQAANSSEGSLRTNIQMPTPEGSLGHPDYTVIDIIDRMSAGESRDKALEKERQVSYEIAIEKDTTNVLGGK